MLRVSFPTPSAIPPDRLTLTDRQTTAPSALQLSEVPMMASFVAVPSIQRPQEAARSARARGVSLVALVSAVLASSLLQGCTRAPASADPAAGGAGSSGSGAGSATGKKSLTANSPPSCDVQAFGRSRVDELVREDAKIPDSEKTVSYIDGPTAAVAGDLLTISSVLCPVGGNGAWNEQEIWACVNGAMVQVNGGLPKIDKRLEKSRSSEPSITSVGGNRYEVTYTVWLDSDPNCCPSTQNVITVELREGAFQVVKSDVR